MTTRNENDLGDFDFFRLRKPVFEGLRGMKFFWKFLLALLVPLSIFIGMRLLQPVIVDTISKSVEKAAGSLSTQIGGISAGLGGGFGGGSAWGRDGNFDPKFVKP